MTLRMDNPYFLLAGSTETDDYFTPIHAILSPSGDVMLLGFRQAGLSQLPQTLKPQRTGSMAAILHEADLINPPASGEVTLINLGEHRDLSCGVRVDKSAPIQGSGSPPTGLAHQAEFVESDPNDFNRRIFTDRTFCSGHTVVNETIVLVGGLRIALRWDETSNTSGGVVQMTDATFGGGTPFVQRWDWGIDGPSWVRLDTALAGYGDPFTGAAASNCTTFLPVAPPGLLPPGNPFLTPSEGGIFVGNERYYATATTTLPGDVLVTAGQWFLNLERGTVTPREFLPENFDSENLSIELYDPDGTSPTGGTGTTKVLSYHPDTGGPGAVVSPPEIFNPAYTHVFVLPKPFNVGTSSEYGVMMLGDAGKPLGFSLQPAEWYQSWPARPLPPPASNSPTVPLVNNSASTVLLPIRLSGTGGGVNDLGYHNGAFLCAGGYTEDQTAVPPAPKPRTQIDVFDPFAGPSGTGAWSASANLVVPRLYCCTVILPDGRILVVGGMSHERGYHVIALLLQDGRVLVGCGRPGGPTGSLSFERADYTILSPPYVQQPRPQITFVTNKVLSRQNPPSGQPTSPLSTSVGVTMAQQWDVPSEAVLISLGSMTHSFDMNQRYVEVAITNLTAVDSPEPKFTMKIWAPEYEWAPPGYYMLFILDQNGIPSPAAMIRLE